MPKLLLKNMPPKRGRRQNYGPPRSPFQKLIHNAVKKNGYSGRRFAMDRLGVNPGSFWIWLHNESGFPHPKSCKPHHLEVMSKHLDIPLATIHEALDSSRHLFTQREKSIPVDAVDGLVTLIEILEHDGRTTLTKSYVLNLAKKLLAGMTGKG